MKTYIVTTGAMFALLALAHLARMAVEGVHLIAQPVFVLTTLMSIGVCVWAVVLLRPKRAS